jgi:hypothetical protein
MALIPNFTTTAYIFGDDDHQLPYVIDLTEALIKIYKVKPSFISGLLDGSYPLTRVVLRKESLVFEGGQGGSQTGVYGCVGSTLLPLNIRQASWEQEVSLPEIVVDLKNFSSNIGGMEGFQSLMKAKQEVKDCQRCVDDAKKELRILLNAQWQPNIGEFVMVYGSQFHDDYANVDELEEVLLNTYWDDFTAFDPEPNSDVDDEVRAEWEERYHDWLRKNVTPYAFGTEEDIWAGVSAADIRNQYIFLVPGQKDDRDPTLVGPVYNEDFNILDDLEGEMADHHEDAMDSIADADELVKIFARWKPHAGYGTPEDLALETDIAAWNAKQHIVTYNYNRKVAVPIFEDVTKDEACAWCERALELADAALAKARDAWHGEEVACSAPRLP